MKPARLPRTLSLQIGRRTLPMVLGVLDGITNALGLTSGSLLHGGSAVTLSLAFRVAGFALATALLALFGGRYVELRVGLIRASKQLNLLKRGALATTRLGRTARWNALMDALYGGVASFLGALLPLLVAAMLPGLAWLSLVVALGMLALLGVLIARQISANVLQWAGSLAAAGVILIVVGAQLNIALSELSGRPGPLLSWFIPTAPDDDKALAKTHPGGRWPAASVTCWK